MLFTHRDQVICGVQAQKKEKLKVTPDIDGNRPPFPHPPPQTCFRGLKIYPAKVNLKKNKPVGVAKMK